MADGSLSHVILCMDDTNTLVMFVFIRMLFNKTLVALFTCE